MPGSYREKTEYFVEGANARLTYRRENEEAYTEMESRYTYRNSRGQRVTVPRSLSSSRYAERRVNEDYYDYVPVEEPRQYEEEKKKAKPEKQPVKRVDFPTLIVLCLVLGALCYMCFSYLSVQSEVSALKSEIADVEREISVLKNENADRLLQVETNVDLEKVYRIATKELGMVHPKKQQVIKYQSKKSDTVKQYQDIPEGRKTFVEKILE